jgi:hypothetical protein
MELEDASFTANNWQRAEAKYEEWNSWTAAHGLQWHAVVTPTVRVLEHTLQLIAGSSAVARLPLYAVELLSGADGLRKYAGSTALCEVM